MEIETDMEIDQKSKFPILILNLRVFKALSDLRIRNAELVVQFWLGMGLIAPLKYLLGIRG